VILIKRYTMALRFDGMIRFFESYGIIFFGLVLAFYGVASTTFTLGQTAGVETELILQQAALEQYSERASPSVRPNQPETSDVPVSHNAPRVADARPGNETQEKPAGESGAPQRLKNAGPLLPRPTTTPPPSEAPTRIVIPEIDLDAPVVLAETYFVEMEGENFQQWLAPNSFAVGWHADSARLGEPGNTVLNGHNNIYGEVFRFLTDISVGDTILVYGEDTLYRYQVTNHMILPERFEQLDVRMNNAQWILPSQDERLTLITCWPYESNTHRLIVVAKPISQEKLARKLQ
jgi:LPXTG-site transpeptidase (sortase) family protein